MKLEPLDHGMLNVPLNKRVGDIDSQLDKYKKEQAKLDREKREERRERVKDKKLEIKRIMKIYRSIPSSNFRAAAKKYNVPTKELREIVTVEIKFRPERGLKMLEMIKNIC